MGRRRPERLTANQTGEKQLSRREAWCSHCGLIAGCDRNDRRWRAATVQGG